MKRKKPFDHLVQNLLGAAVLAAALPDLAWAQSATGQPDLNATATQLTSQISTIPQFVSAILWVGGTVLMGAGVLKLKEHAENPT